MNALAELLNTWKSIKNLSATLLSVLSACAVGTLLLFSHGGDGLARLSFDIPFLFRPPIPANDLVIVEIEEATLHDPMLNDPMKFRYPFFDRSTHAKFLNKLKADGARLVVFDIFFDVTTDEDPLLAAAITNHGNVVMVADLGNIDSAEFFGAKINDPAEAFLNLPGCRIGLADVHPPDADDVVREFPSERDDISSLPFVAAEALGKNIRRAPREDPRYIRFYGDTGALNFESYGTAFDRHSGYFTNKIVFIGGKPKIGLLDEKDLVSTPFRRWGGVKMPGVELQATMFLNLLRHEWLTRLAFGKELLVILGAGFIFGLVFSQVRPAPGLFWLAGFALSISALAIAIFWSRRIWFDWVLVSAAQPAMAWASAALVYSVRLLREKQMIEKELETIRTKIRTQPISGPVVNPMSDVKDVLPLEGEVEIHDFQVLRSIGEGAYGKVWLARSLTGTYRAIKVVYRRHFEEQRPFEREFEGVRNFEPISRNHPGWVSILYVGKEQSGGFFYYIMEPADDLVSGSVIDPSHYTPKTLGKLLVEKAWLPVPECVSVGVHLADALGALHKLGLVHRDVKPSNIIFVNGHPKLADIGLVASAHAPRTFAGTEGFIPPEGPGTPQADVFSLGRALYQAATGSDPHHYPGLPTSLGERTDTRDLMRLMEIINKACASFHGNRYQTADELHADLMKLQAGLQRRHGKA